MGEQEEKLLSECRKWYLKQFVIIPIVHNNKAIHRIVLAQMKSYVEKAYLQGRRDEAKERQEEIDRRVIEAVDKLHEAEKEIEGLKKYEGMWLRLKDQLRRDREHGYLCRNMRRQNE